MKYSNPILEYLLKDGENETMCLCASYSENVLKVACAMANGRGGNILLGVGDDNSIVGITEEKIKCAIANLSHQIVPTLPFTFNVLDEAGKKVLVVSVWMGSQKPYTALKDFYVQEGDVVRKANLNQVDALFEERALMESSWERKPNRQTDIDSLAKSVLERFRLKFIAAEKCTSTAGVEEICKLLNFIVDDSITNAGTVVLHEHPSEVLSQMRIRISLFGDSAGTELINVRLFDGNLVQTVDEITTYVMDLYPPKINISNNQRVQIESLSKVALREGLLNAVVHRKYDTYDSFVAINLYSDRVEIINSGSLPQGITVADLKSTHKSILRNPDIANAFFTLGYIEMAGSGTRRIINECEHINGEMPFWKNEDGYVTLTFPAVYHRQSAAKTKDWMSVASKLNVEDGVAQSLTIILEYLSMNKSVKLDKLAEITGKSYPTVKRYTQMLKTANLIYYEGNNRTGGWNMKR